MKQAKTKRQGCLIPLILTSLKQLAEEENSSGSVSEGLSKYEEHDNSRQPWQQNKQLSRTIKGYNLLKATLRNLSHQLGLTS